MARGQNLVIANNSGILVNTLTREVKDSVAILNPNDGVIYVRLNELVSTTATSGWDWKLPSQSYGLFPGPWQSLGVFFLDQSGAGRQGDITLYESDLKLDIPDIRSIGRALQAQATSLDVTEGAQPANPAVGITRIWSANDGSMHHLLSTGLDDIVARLVTAQILQNKTFDSSSNIPVRIGKILAPDSTNNIYSFINIPQGYSALRLTCHAASMALLNNDTYYLRFNNNITSLYTWQDLSATGASIVTAVGGPTSSGKIGSATGANNTSSLSGSCEVIIPHYSDLSYEKSWLSRYGSHIVFNSQLVVGDLWGNWDSGAVITELDIICGSASFRQGSQFILEAIP